MKILIIDNYDSFTFNLAHYLESFIDESVTVIRNDQLDLELLGHYDRIVISPGPGLPDEAGYLMEAIQQIPVNTPVLAVCLGMQAYALHSGGDIFNLEKIHHGVQVDCSFDQSSILFRNLKKQNQVGLYHSWAVVDNLTEDWKVTARSLEGVIMAMEHVAKPIFCVQFHPESVLTPQGKLMVKNFLDFPT